MIPDNKPIWVILDVPKKMSIMKRLRQTALVTFSAVYLLGSTIHYKTEYVLGPNDQLTVTLSSAETNKQTKQPIYQAYSAFVFLTASSGNWTVPTDWKNTSNRFDLIGGGGGGGDGYLVSAQPPASGFTGANRGVGGGGGGYTSLINKTLTVGSSISYTVGVGASHTSTINNPPAGGTTTILSASAGGGTTRWKGGNTVGGSGTFTGGVGNIGGGGGGAAGPSGNGGAGNGSVGGIASGGATAGTAGHNLGDGSKGSGGGGTGGDAAPGQNGGSYGGGGGGGGAELFNPPSSGTTFVGGSGANGIIVISYNPMLVSTTTLTSSINPSGFNQSVTFTATVTSGATGTVTFSDGATVLATQSIVGTNATFSTSNLAIGTHSIKATYNGDSNYFSSNSSVVSQVVRVIGQPFQVFINY